MFALSGIIANMESLCRKKNNRSVKQDIPCILHSLPSTVNNETAQSDMKSGSRDYCCCGRRILPRLFFIFSFTVSKGRCDENRQLLEDCYTKN